MHLFRILPFLVLMLFSGSSFASTNGYLIAFIDFTCGACKGLHEQKATFEALMKERGLTVYYAPVPQSGNPDTAWRERMYYVTRDLIGEQKANEVMASYFAAQGGLGEQSEPLSTYAQVEAWLGLKIDGVRWRSLMRDSESKGFGVPQVQKAINLFVDGGFETFPAFALVENGSFAPIRTSGNLEQKLKQLSSSKALGLGEDKK